MTFKFKPSKETEEAIERRLLIQKLIERRYGPFAGAGGAGRILLEGSLKEQAIETLRAWEASALAHEVREKNRKAKGGRP